MPDQVPLPEEPTTQSPTRPQLTRRERRRRVILLALLLALLALLAYLTYYFTQNRSLPSIATDTRGVQQIAPPQYLYSITGSGANQLDRPVGVAVKNGRLYVVDFGKHRISVFTERGRFLYSFRDAGGGKQLARPNVIAIRGNEVWVTDRLRRALYVYTLEGKLLREFKPKGEEKKWKWAPFAMAFARDGRFVVTDVGDTKRHRVHFFSEDGSRTATVGQTAGVTGLTEAPGGFLFPSSVAIDKTGTVFVSDGDNRRIQVFDKNAEFKRFLESSGIPRGSAFDAKNRLVVVDALAHNADIYSTKGDRLTQFGSQGFGPGQFNYPGFVAINDRNRIFISDRENNQVQVWGWPVAQPPAIAPPSTPLGWLACLSPLLLLPFLLLLRKKRVVVTADFVEALIAAGEIAAVAKRRNLRLICPDAEHVFYQGRQIDGIDLGELITPEPHSESDTAALKTRLEVPEREAILLSMAYRARALATEDRNLRRMAILAEVKVVSLEEFLEAFLRR